MSWAVILALRYLVLRLAYQKPKQLLFPESLQYSGVSDVPDESHT